MGGEGGDHALVAEELAGDVGVVEGDAAEADVDAAFLEGGDLFEGGEFQEDELDAGPGGAVGADDAGEVAVEGGADEADAEDVAAALLQAAHGGAHFFHAVQDLDGLFIEDAALLGEDGGAGAAGDEGDAELLFELLDLAGQGGLGDVQAGGGAGEGALLGDGHEVLEVAELHWIPFRYGRG